MKSNTRARKSNPLYILFVIVLSIIILILISKPLLKFFFPVKYEDYISRYSREYNLDEHLVMAIISTESKFDKDAVSHRNAKGLMQLKDDTALWCIEKFGIVTNGEDIHDPTLNIRIGCAYLRYLMDKFGSNTKTALAAYNAGEGNVTKWLNEAGSGYELNDIPFGETKKYVDTVLSRTKMYHYLY